MLLNNQWINEEIKKEIKNRNKRQGKCNNPQPVGHSKSGSKREVYSSTILTQKQERSQINNPTLQL